MEQKPKNMFREIAVPAGITTRILAHIERARIRAARVRLALFSSSALLTSIAVVPAYAYLSTEATQSGFTQYLSLLRSDGDILLVHWKEFILSLTESLPLAGMTMLLAIVFVLLWLIPKVSESAHIAFGIHRRYAL